MAAHRHDGRDGAGMTDPKTPEDVLREALAAVVELRALSEASAPGPWQWLDGEDEGDELQDGHGEMVATGFRENLVLNGKPINRDGSFAAAAVNYVRAALSSSESEETAK